MHPLVWLAFALAYTLMAAAPGPVVAVVISYALTSGRRASLAVVAGTALGDATILLAAALGVGALLATSAEAFTLLKLGGALYLVVLGILAWRAPPAAAAAGPPRSRRRIFLHAYATTVLNPKGVLFFAVFLPQFLDARRPFLPQVAIMAATVMIFGLLVDGSYSLLATRLAGRLRSIRARRMANRFAGLTLIAEGTLAALWHRA
ncbi:MAG: LysE family translocator [Rhodospirillales bacterium]|nr:LysE family translocator [Rhodospirillales bacterium]